MNQLLTKIGLASTSSLILTEAINLDTLWSALISVAVSVLSVLAVEGVNVLRAYFNSKSRKYENTENKDDKSKEE